MDEQYTEPEEKQENNEEAGVEIYSKMAIRGFSIFFSTLFGGALLFINLKNAGYKSAAYKVLAFAVGYTLLASILFSNIKGAVGGGSVILNLIGGVILADYFFPKYFPDNDYYPRSIWGALGVSLILCFSIILVLYYTGNLPELNIPAPKK
ncbi:hypothetical protein [Mucilaginibacter boryungensis]|uniref:SPW repeat-containing protein n=1 Tax=Mucilaginibacter boryungensis TaxID=768480 RepID=A0ABR9XLC2_9SPHI|nr:hypothetical protein [Mucilaginibacter boryungensis]MBE9667869.1 hypothetical protein [Mucilaginibacter boryungensis]